MCVFTFSSQLRKTASYPGFERFLALRELGPKLQAVVDWGRGRVNLRGVHEETPTILN